MDPIFTVDQFPAILSGINSELNYVNSTSSHYESMPQAAKQAIFRDLQHASSTLETLGRSIELSLARGEQSEYENWKKQFSPQVERLAQLTSSVLHSANSQPDTEADEKTHLLQEQCFTVELHQDILYEREERIGKVTSAMQMVHGMLRELGELVTDQGAVIDTIEAHMDSAGQHSRSAVNQLTKTVENYKSSRQRGCLICVLTTLLLFVLGLILAGYYT